MPHPSKRPADWLNPGVPSQPQSQSQPAPGPPKKPGGVDALSVTCPRCGAPSNRACVSPFDGAETLCASRVRLAMEKALSNRRR